MKAMDHRTHSLVAIKIVKNERPFLRQAREEIRILEALRRQDKNDSHNIVHILDSFTFRGHVCITFELLGMSLHQVRREKRKPAACIESGIHRHSCSYYCNYSYRRWFFLISARSF